MSGDRVPTGDPFMELRFALTEADAVSPSPGLRDRVLAAATAARTPGRDARAPAHISGADVFRRTASQLSALLSELSPADWSRPALRRLDVQGLIGHLVGVEELFLAALGGDEEAAAGDHIASSDAAAARQGGRPPAATQREWSDRVSETLAAVSQRDAASPVTFYGVTLPLDDLLVVRAFEMWTHDEDVRRATGRALVGVDPERLARMVPLATMLLPAGIARAGKTQPGRTVRLVLTGTGGGTWDVNLDGTRDVRRADTRVVMDATQFCRAVGNRIDAAIAAATVQGDPAIALAVLAGAAALALD